MMCSCFWAHDFLAVHRQLNRWPCLSVRLYLGWTQLTIKPFTTLPSDPRDLSSLRHLIRVMRRHDLTKKSAYHLPTYPEQLNRWPCHWFTHWLTDWLTDGTFTFDIHSATPETCDIWNIWSESLGDMTWPKKYLPTFTGTGAEKATTHLSSHFHFHNDLNWNKKRQVLSAHFQLNDDRNSFFSKRMKIPSSIESQYLFSCPEQLNRWPCHSLSHSLTDWLTDSLTEPLLIFDIK